MILLFTERVENPDFPFLLARVSTGSSSPFLGMECPLCEVFRGEVLCFSVFGAVLLLDDLEFFEVEEEACHPGIFIADP